MYVSLFLMYLCVYVRLFGFNVCMFLCFLMYVCVNVPFFVCKVRMRVSSYVCMYVRGLSQK